MMKSKIRIMFATLFCLFAAMQAGAQIPPPTDDDGGNDGPVVYYYACTNSDGTAVFTRVRLSPQEAAALCDTDDDGNIGTPFG